MHHLGNKRRTIQKPVSLAVPPLGPGGSLGPGDPVGAQVLIVKFSINCDISSIHQVVLKHLAKQADDEPKLQKELQNVTQLIEASMCIPEIKFFETRKLKIEQELASISKHTKEFAYTSRANRYIELYRHLSSVSAVANEIQLERVISDYLALAAEYIPLYVQREKHKNTQRCVYCGANLSNICANAAGIKICANTRCGMENSAIKNISSASKEYDVWNNFLKTYYRFTGVTELKNIDIVMSDLDIYFTSKGKPSGEYYRRQPLNAIGRKDGTSHVSLCEAFVILGYVGYYKYYMYIGHKYYGWKLWQLDHLLVQMEKNFKLKQEAWKQLTSDQKQGQSSLSTEFRLCMELNHVGVPCDISWFRISEKQKSLEKNFSVYRLMCQGAGFTFPHTTPTINIADI